MKAFAQLVIVALAQFPLLVLAQRVQLNFEDDPLYITPGPDVGIPSPDGNCVGSGCSSTREGKGFGAGSPGTAASPQFPAKQGGETNFRSGSMEYGPSWANGGYLGSVLDPLPIGADVMGQFRRSLTQVWTGVTADNVFPRQQIFADLGMLDQVLEGMRRDRVIGKYPRVLAPLPPTVAQFLQLSDETFEKNLGPVRDAGKVKTDWEWWKADLRSKTVPQLVDISWKRDLALGDAYLGVVKDAIQTHESVVGAKASTIVGDLRSDPPLLYRHSLRSATVAYVVSRKDAEMLAPSGLAAPLDGQLSIDAVRKKSNELLKRSAGAVPPLPQGGIARMLADLALIEADYAMSDDQVAEAVLMQQFASALLEVSISFVPVAGQGMAIYEYVTGRSLINGEEIPIEQRTISGVMLAGTFARASAPAVLKMLDRLKEEAELLNKGPSNLLAQAGKPTSTARFVEPPKFGEITGIRQGAEVNADAAIARGKRLISDGRPWATDRVAYESAWQGSELVVEGKTAAPLRLVRLHNEATKNGTWLAAEADVANLSKNELRNRFNLPSTPTMRTDVTLPAGTQVRYGRVGKNAFGVSEGSRQIEVTPGTLKVEWFGPSVPLQ